MSTEASARLGVSIVVPVYRLGPCQMVTLILLIWRLPIGANLSRILPPIAASK